MRITVLVCVGLAAIAGTASATTWFEQTTICPVGRKSFKHAAIGSYTTWGEMPDGMPLGSGPFPMPLTECPDNGLVLWRDFTKAEVERLTPLVASERYQALRKTDTQSYRAWWLANELGERDGTPWRLLTATWEAKAEPANADRIARYQNAFIDAALARPVDAKSLETVAMRARAVNALRELGRFEDAERERAAIVIADDAVGGEDAARNRAGWRTFIEQLRVAIARRDAARGPIDMIGDREAAFRCAAPDIPRMKESFAPLGQFEREFCMKPEVAKMADEIRNANRESAPQ